MWGVAGDIVETVLCVVFFFFSSRRRHTRLVSDWSSDVCSSDPDDVLTLIADTLALVRLRRTQTTDVCGHLAHSLLEIGRASCRERV